MSGLHPPTPWTVSAALIAALKEARAELVRYVDLQVKLKYFEYALVTEGKIALVDAALAMSGE